MKGIEMNKTVYLASCPICGRSLFKGKPDSYIEGVCPKCKKYLKISFTSDGVQSSVCEIQEEKSIREELNMALSKR